jgi:1-acyl-sn-glycerol-3-phosphate acyltransferase
VAAKRRLVEEGFAVQYYPEGTRSRDGVPRAYENIKVTLMHLAYLENIPVIPVSMYGTHKVLTKWGTIVPFQKLAIKTHSALWPKDYADANEFARAAWARVVSGHAELRSKLES